MNTDLCKMCGKSTRNEKFPLCTDCEEKSISKIKKFIDQTGVTDTPTVCRVTRIPLTVVKYLIDEGRIFDKNKKGDNDLKRINNLKVATQLGNALKTDMKKEPPKPSMHYLTEDRRRRK